MPSAIVAGAHHGDCRQSDRRCQDAGRRGYGEGGREGAERRGRRKGHHPGCNEEITRKRKSQARFAPLHGRSDTAHYATATRSIRAGAFRPGLVAIDGW